jgi:hypothetical protein
LSRIRTALVVCALALPIPAAIAGCGGSDSSSSDEDPQTVLDETFNNDTRVTSGDLQLNASLSAEGDQGGQLDVSLGGPFQGDPNDENAIPQLDWTASLSGQGAGQSIDFSGGLVVTDDNAYVEYKDQPYEVGAKAFSSLRDQLESQASSSSQSTGGFTEQCQTALQQAGATDTSGCDIDLESWLTNLTNEGTEDVGGAETVHISGDADVNTILTDIGNLASAVPSASAQGFDPSQLGTISDAVTDASIDVYSGVDDHVLRKLDATLTIDPSAIAGGAVIPVSNIQISFSVEIDGVNEDQTISAPSGAKPISQLLGDLGVSPDALGGLGSLGGGIPGADSGSGGSGGGGGNSAAYLDCIQQATSPSQINDCASQL